MEAVVAATSSILARIWPRVGWSLIAVSVAGTETVTRAWPARSSRCGRHRKPQRDPRHHTERGVDRVGHLACRHGPALDHRLQHRQHVRVIGNFEATAPRLRAGQLEAVE